MFQLVSHLRLQSADDLVSESFLLELCDVSALILNYLQQHLVLRLVLRVRLPVNGDLLVLLLGDSTRVRGFKLLDRRAVNFQLFRFALRRELW